MSPKLQQQTKALSLAFCKDKVHQMIREKGQISGRRTILSKQKSLVIRLRNRPTPVIVDRIGVLHKRDAAWLLCTVTRNELVEDMVRRYERLSLS